MSVDFFCPLWGSENLSWNFFFEKVKKSGYDGVEWAISNDTAEKKIEDFWNLAEKHNLKIIPQFFESGNAVFSKHFDLYCKWFEKIKPYSCFKIDSQTGRDFYSFEQNQSLIREADQFTLQTGVKVFHETHRNKCLFAAHVAKEYLQKNPNLQITLDASHWVCVAESFLDDQPKAMELAIERTGHIHARVGYPEGPQVSDPRLPEWKPAVEAHLAWWDRVVALKKGQNETLSITSEFGPYPYMVHLPSDGKPISNQWNVNVYMMNLLRKRYC